MIDSDDDWGLEMELLCLPSSGGSVRQMQTIAARIAKSCSQAPPRVVELGGLSADSHRERDLHRWASKQAWRKLLPEPFVVDLPWTSNQIDEDTAPQSVLLPHEVFANIASFPDLFDVLFKGVPGALQTFWENASWWCERHPLYEELRATPELCIPIGMHGDEGGVYGSSNSVLVLTWGSVAHELVTLDSRILFAGVLLNTVVPGKTLEALYKVFVWSLNCMARGEYPATDHNGVPFSAAYTPKRHALRGHRLHQTGLRGVWSELRGDWKWQVESLHLTSITARTTCVICAVLITRLSGCGTPTLGGQHTIARRGFAGVRFGIRTRTDTSGLIFSTSLVLTFGGAGVMRCIV